MYVYIINRHHRAGAHSAAKINKLCESISSSARNEANQKKENVNLLTMMNEVYYKSWRAGKMKQCYAPGVLCRICIKSKKPK